MKKLIATCMTVAFLGSAGLVFAEAAATPTVKPCHQAGWQSGKKTGKNGKPYKKGPKQCKVTPATTPTAQEK